jgi:L-alanine-DL-glutamate epimerase-like enolase superfamily enzyme
MKLSAAPLDLELKHRFTIARDSYAVRRNAVVRLRWRGIEGLGEAAPMAFYGQSQRSCLRALARMATLLAHRDPFDGEAIIAELRRRFPRETGAVAAVDLALHDLVGKALRQPLWRLWGLDPARAPQTSFTIGIDTIAKVAEKVVEAARFPVLKVKVGVADDLEILREVRRLEPRKRLRVDANGGWTARETIAKSRVLERLGVEFIEQPLPVGREQELRGVRARVGIPLMADESCVSAERLPELVGCFDAVNIKLAKCGGLREALRMIHVARASGFTVMIGCMIESSLLITAAAQLSPLADYADLDGHVLIAHDPFRGVRLDRGARLVLPRSPGLGVRSR